VAVNGPGRGGAFEDGSIRLTVGNAVTLPEAVDYRALPMDALVVSIMG
jgi:hypothetical protein